MKLIEVLNQIPKLDRDILVSAPRIDATEYDVSCYLKESGMVIETSDIRKAMDTQARLLEYLNQISVTPCSIQEDNYPKRLKEISTAPAVIYYKGNVKPLNDTKIVAIIGTREPSEDGKKISHNLGNVLSEKGYGVVNGLAIGCDTYALQGCLDASHSYPVAVLPCGLDKIYPKQNLELADEIVKKGGCLISEYVPKTAVQKYNYVQRDRIQAGLSDGVIMVEAMLDSGTMHTVNYAKKFNRYIACYKEKQGRFSGNQHLIDNGILALEDNESLKVFEENINKKAYHQVTLFD